jgi:hypothetical protein
VKKVIKSTLRTHHRLVAYSTAFGPYDGYQESIGNNKQQLDLNRLLWERSIMNECLARPFVTGIVLVDLCVAGYIHDILSK